MTNPTLAILVPCLASRPWQKVVTHLERQARTFSKKVTVVHFLDSGEMTSGQKRQLMCGLPEVASAAYRCFVDDDDEVSPFYVQSMLEGCESDADVVSFDLEFVNAAKRVKRERWSFGLFPNNRSKGLMCVNHLCAWKTELANKVAWCPRLGYGDDHLWFQPLYHADVIKTHYHVDSVLYNYLYNPNVTANQRYENVIAARAYVGRGLGCYLMPDGGILIEDGHDAPEGYVDLRDRDNLTTRHELTHRLKLRYYHNVTIA